MRLQRGGEPNELMKYRYSVVLHIESSSQPEQIAPVIDATEMDVQAITQYLQQHQPDSVCFRGVPNQRVVTDVCCVEHLAATQDKLTVRQLQQLVSETSGPAIDPEQLHQLSTELGYHLEVCWSVDRHSGCFDAVFVRPELAQEQVVLTPLTQQSVVGGDWHRYGNNPLAPQQAKQVIPQLKTYLEQQLPEYMLPNGWVILPQFPLMPNGKVDRRALPEPDFSSHLSTDFVAPQTAIENQLAAIWSEVLDLDLVGIHDNFFELGGHSLLATQIVSRMQKAFERDFPLRLLFEFPDILGLAKYIETVRRTERSLQQVEVDTEEVLF